jgi:hypothetical protein
VEEIGDRIDGGFHHGDQAANQEVSRQQVSDAEGDTKVRDGKGDGFDQ